MIRAEIIGVVATWENAALPVLFKLTKLLGTWRLCHVKSPGVTCSLPAFYDTYRKSAIEPILSERKWTAPNMVMQFLDGTSL
jgi:hypothetical protein